MSDLISSGSERDPWRPSRRLVVVVAVALLVVAALAYAGRELQQRRASSAAAERVARQVVLEVGASDVDPLQWVLENRSPTHLTVTSVRLDFPAGELFGKAQALPAYGSTNLAPARLICDDGLYDRGPTALMVDAETRQGLRITRRLNLNAEARSGIWTQLRGICHFALPADALVGEVADAAFRDGALRLTYSLSNVGESPLTVEGITYVPGVSVTTVPAKLVLPPLPRAVTFGTPTRLVVLLRVSSCPALVAALAAAAGGDGMDGPGYLKPQLRDAHTSGIGYLDLANNEVRLFRTCPKLASYTAP